MPAMSVRARRVNASCTTSSASPEVEQHAKGEIEHPSPVGLPERGEHRIVGAGRGVVRSFHRGSHRVSWRKSAVTGAHAFLRMPSCQISFSIDGLALGVATAIVERTYVSLERLAQQAIGQVDPGGEPVADVVDGDAVLRNGRRLEQPRRADDRPREVAVGHHRLHPAHVVIEGLAELVDDIGLHDLLEDEPAERLGVWADRTGADAHEPLDARGVHAGDDVGDTVRSRR